MTRLALPFLALSALLAACIEVKQDIEITPGTVPAEIRGARWNDLPVSYCVVPGGEGFVDDETLVDLTQQAVSAWGIEATYDGECAAGIESANGVNEVGWGDLGARGDRLTEAGNTSLRYRTTPGGGSPEIIEADITLERAPGEKETEECLYTTILHEAGHLFGVPHIGQDDIMAPVIIECRQELTEADRAALAELY